MNNIKRLRTINDVSRKRLAERCGVTVPAVYNWEQGKCKPDAKNRKKLESFFHYPLDADPKGNGLPGGVIVSANPRGEIVYGDGVKIFPRRNDYHDHEK